ncbi:MAG TPA: alpha/beta fold hydrolase, partial [Mycobacteriales bacterium]
MPADGLGTEAAAWWDRGRHVELLGQQIFVVDLPPGTEENRPPLLVIHGFPTSSLDYAGVADALAARRRVVLLDLPGYGFSGKPDRPYPLAG